jgi:adenosylcobinamide-GDP ribazoletransferase
MMARLVAAIRFLTIIPLPGHLGRDEETLAGSLIYFPLVGVAIGLVMAIVGWLLWPLLPALPAAAVMVLLLFAISGAFHLDGLADTFDGLFSARPREEVLLIMRDSHIGTMGVVALVMVLLMKTAALASLPQEEAASALFLMPLAGRCLMIFMMALLPYVRGPEGRAALFYEKAAEKKVILVAGGLLYSGCWYAGGGSGLVAGAVVLVAMLGFAGLCRARIGGATGDTLGATCELTETLIALVLASGW